MKQIVDHGLRLLFPPTCPGCGIIVAQTGSVCASCWQELQFITKPYCPVMGTPFAYDHGQDILSAYALKSPPPFKRARSALIHNGLARSLVTRLKYGDRTELAPSMARWMAHTGSELLDECDMIIPVPLHWRRFFRRSYNQAAELARHLAMQNNKPMRPELLSRNRHTSQQVGLIAKERKRNVYRAFIVPLKHEKDIKNRHILLIDDVYTTGATVIAATRALRHAGAAQVDILTFSRVLN
ncbi:ComF family protein [Bartonella tamiae]|uniref:ComF family protein n=1 Tax=Bartonella tamiae Th239 TaxID=1094558 RepID=J0ZPG2_9HYPH|nr:ComF family protein [Bartonella tamiae]EJF90463.1 comF family protein [Bartonella tamiae Th239]EJF93593.1 comF family protein [Bartonella tamiae Th307]